MNAAVARLAKPALGRLERASGGPARMRVVVLLASVLALDTADVGTIGAVAGKLETALHISNVELGLLVALPTLTVALATLPIGMFTDRFNRVRLLVIGVVVWSAGEAASGASQSFLMLLLIRLVVGAGTAPASPTLASLVGDYFPARDRAHIWGLLLTGELLGAGFGFIVAGEFASLGSWRLAFFALAVPSFVVAYVIRRWLPEPARGGRNQLEPGAIELVPGSDAAIQAEQDGDAFEPSEAQEAVAERRVPADEALVLHEDPTRMTIWEAGWYVLRVRTNLILIVTSALGYFYFTGVQTFAIVFVRGRYGLSHGTAVLILAAIGLAAIGGVILGGWLADRLMSQGHMNSRIIVGGLGFVGAAVLFFPGLLSHSLPVSVAFFMIAGIAFGARNPPLDAARLDVMHHLLWGRAEAVRTMFRRLAVAAAPITFGAIADQLAGGPAIAGAHGFGANASARGLHLALLLLLVTLAAGGALTLWAVKTYQRDVSTAVASERATARELGDGSGG